METPIATAFWEPSGARARAAEIAAITAVMVDEFVDVISMDPVVAPQPAVTCEFATFAVVWPAMRLTAVAPPPLKDVAPPDTDADKAIADAVEVASIALLSEAVTLTLPPDRSNGTFAMAASVAVRISLRETLSATVTATAPLSWLGLVPRLTETAIAGALTVEVIVALSAAATVTSPPATMDGPLVRSAWVKVLTLFIAITAPTAMDFSAEGSGGFSGLSAGLSAGFFSSSVLGGSGGFGSVETATVRTDDFTWDVITPAVSALIAIPSAALSVEPVTVAAEVAGFSVPMPRPSRASAKLNRMFCESHPMELKAIVMPTPVFAAWVRLVISAVIVEVFCALTRTPPLAAVSALLVTDAAAPLSTRFVAAMMLRAQPEVASTTTLLRSLARMVAVSRAVTETPAGPATVRFVISERTPPRTSLLTKTRPTPWPSTPPDRKPPQ